MDDYDLIIIGSGSGNGIPEYLSDQRIALVEKGVFGGTCLNRGCIPSKMFVLPGDLAQWAREGERIGVHATVDQVDFDAIRDRTFGLIDPIAASGEEYRAEGTPNVTLLAGTARFVGDKELRVDLNDGGTVDIRAPKVLVAAGARPHLPDIRGLDEVRFHTSDTIMRLEERPKRLGVVGSGFIAAEMAHVFSSYGTEVTVFSRSGRFLTSFDPEIADHFTGCFEHRVHLVTGTVDAVVAKDDGLHLYCSDEPVTVVDELLIATGRVPNADLLDAEAGGLELTDDGRIVVDDTMATGVEGVWAIGDVANPHQLKHLANREAAAAFWNLAHPDEEPRRVDTRALPAAVFSDPQVATVGITELEAEALGHHAVVGRRNYGNTAYGWALDDHTSFAKVVIDADDRQILGAHLIGPHASTLIQPLVQAMQFRQPADAVAREVFYIHPALSEVIENALLDALERIDQGH